MYSWLTVVTLLCYYRDTRTSSAASEVEFTTDTIVDTQSQTGNDAQQQPVTTASKFCNGISFSANRACHILLCEDNTICARITKNCLQRLGCSVEVAGNGAIAVDLVHKNPDIYDVSDCHHYYTSTLVYTIS